MQSTLAPATVTVDPAAALKRIGQTHQFTHTSTGDALAYQWQIDSSATPTPENISGATSASYTTGELTTDFDSSFFRVIVSNTESADTSAWALLRVSIKSSIFKLVKPKELARDKRPSIFKRKR
jgi:hypothetical protein